MKESLLKEFAAPGSQYRGKPFWAWNGKLEPEELRRQIRIMRRMGLGGFFMHSRVGLDTAYLSDDWFSCVDACVDEAKKLGMEAWLYDEDRWPSGAAGGLVTKNEKYRMRSLQMTELKSVKGFAWTTGILAVFTAKVKGMDKASNVLRVAKGATPQLAAGESLLVFEVKIQGNSDWYNGFTYLDTLSHDAVAEFIRVTHETYLKKHGKDFGKTIPGIFTDEPNHGHKIGHDNNTGAPAGLPWTAKLPEVFKKRYGYDLIPHLPELYLDLDDVGMSQPRYHYHECVTFLFVDAFGRQIGEWCGKHGLQFTGHVLEEDLLRIQTNVVGDPMRFYEHMQAPGMDLLTEHWRIYLTAKQVSSAARQFGRTWRLTETYGCTGWDFPFLGHKALGDWQVALGINVRCQHLSWYTMEGEAKRDYPAGIFYQSPWWEEYVKVEDYFARIISVMTKGEEIRDLLVVHPVESMWTMVRRGWLQHDAAVEELDRTLLGLQDLLLGEHIDFDYGSEELMARHATIVKSAGGTILRFGLADYKAVVVPPLKTIRASTVEPLRKFKAAGGVVVLAGEPASHVDAVASRAAADLAKQSVCIASIDAKLVKAVGMCRRLSIADEKGREVVPVLQLLREDKDNFYLFLCNTGEDYRMMKNPMDSVMARDRSLEFPSVTITGLPGCAGRVLELNPETGVVTVAAASIGPRGVAIRTSFPKLGSRLFVIEKKKDAKAASCPKLNALNEVKATKIAPSRWGLTLSEANCLPLDRASLRIEGGEWRKPEEILRVDREVRKALGVPSRGGGMKQPWAREKKKNPPHKRIELRYEFAASARPSGDLFLALEQPASFADICVNGSMLSLDAGCGWWCGRSLRMLQGNPALIKRGRNEITLVCDYTEQHPGLEIIYLLGAFGVTVKGANVELTTTPGALRVGDWVGQGLAFYSGHVSYQTTIKPSFSGKERIFVRIPAYAGTAAKVWIDGEAAGFIGWEPNEVDVTDFVKSGTVAEVAIEIIGHRRNSHGPFHYFEKWPNWTGPGQFVSGGEQWVDGYQLVPCGLMKPPELVVKAVK